MTYANDSLGRSTGRKFNMAAIKRELAAKRLAEEKRAEGFDERFEEKRKKRDCQPKSINFGR